jgi:hypothetical protein
VTIAEMIRALRAPKDPNPIPRRLRFLRRFDPHRRYDTGNRAGRRAKAFADYYVWTSKTYEMPRKVRREIARDMAKAKLRGTI